MTAPGPDQPRREPKHPRQVTYTDRHGVQRFQPNEVIRWLFETDRISLNEISRQRFPDEDMRQLAQLLGYSVSGYHDLSYTEDEGEEFDPPWPHRCEAVDSAKWFGAENRWLRTALARAEATAEKAVEALEAQGAVVEALNVENARLCADLLAVEGQGMEAGRWEAIEDPSICHVTNAPHRWGTGRARDECDDCDTPRWVKPPAAAPGQAVREDPPADEVREEQWARTEGTYSSSWIEHDDICGPEGVEMLRRVVRKYGGRVYRRTVTPWVEVPIDKVLTPPESGENFDIPAAPGPDRALELLRELVAWNFNLGRWASFESGEAGAELWARARALVEEAS